MKIAIIGAGFTGLSAAYELSKIGHTVTVFEKDPNPGGLAIGYKEKEWKWSLEKHYHHWFTNDNFVLHLAREIGCNVVIKTPKSSFYVQDAPYKFDSPMAILSFPKLPFVDRIRMAAVFGVLFKLNPFWKQLEAYQVTSVVPKLIGKKSFAMLWEPQLVNKMGKYADKISLVWFWARVKKRTTSLAYPEGGFLYFAQRLVTAIEKNGGKVYFNTPIEKLEDRKTVSVTIKTNNKSSILEFDRAIVTLPSFLFLKIAQQLPETYKTSLVKLQGLSATNLVLRLKKSFFSDNTYWMSICDTNAPIMAIIEHTNFMDPRHYHNEHIVYCGNYALTDDKLDWDKKKILELYDPYLKKINPNYRESLIDYEFFTAPFAQPIVPMNYSRLMPKMETPLPHVFLANIEQVYPWDRGTNYAVELGQKVAHLATQNNK